nr:substrate-binding domain-containing protein [Thermosediminibacter litoriperuensis]
MSRTHLVIFLMLFIAVMILAACSYSSIGNEISVMEEEGDRIRVGISLGTLKEERWLKDRDILMAKLKDLGAEVFVKNANNDDEDQLKQVRYLLDQKIDVLILVPNDLQKASAAVQLAKKYGVKVISYDRLVTRSNVDLYISFDNIKVGRLMAEWLIKKAPKGNYLIINGATSDHNTKMIKEGYDSILREKVERGDIKIVAEEWAPDWMTEYAFKVTDEILQSGRRIDAAIAGNDSLAGGIIEALAEHRLAGRVPVVGQDADLAACQRIVEGTQLMTVYKPIDKLAEKAAEMAIRLARGEPLDIRKTIFDGRYYVPYYVLEPVGVDKSNIEDTVIRDGFHSSQDVYRNLPKAH